jgi:hypothetical protein
VGNVTTAAPQEWLAENLGSDCRTELHEVRCRTGCHKCTNLGCSGWRYSVICVYWKPVKQQQKYLRRC